MRLSAERRLDAPPQVVWWALNDVDRLRSCIPGCDKLERTGDGEFLAEVTARIGPVSARFRGTLQLRDLQPPEAYTIAGEGQAGPAGFARGEARVRLRPDGAGTVLAYDVQATVGGKLAQVGSRLVDAAAGKFADSFFECFAGALSPAAEEPRAVVAAGRSGLRPALWVPLLIAVVFFILYLSTRL